MHSTRDVEQAGGCKNLDERGEVWARFINLELFSFFFNFIF